MFWNYISHDTHPHFRVHGHRGSGGSGVPRFTFTDLGCKVAGIGDDLKGKGQELGMI